jgi:SAM-dependent methyltransferase
MLQRTLSSDFLPGSNLRGEVSGANWLFALPTLRPGTVLCLGAPSPAAARALARRADRLIVGLAAGEAVTPPSEVRALICDFERALPLPTGSADLIVLCGREILRSVSRSAALQGELRRVLAPGGLVYVETWGAPPALAGLHMTGRLWLTPLWGETQTAVPLDDHLTRHFFAQRRLFIPVLTVQQLRHALRPNGRSKGVPAADTDAGDNALSRRGLKHRLSRLSRWLESALGDLEALWHQRGRGRVGTVYSAVENVIQAEPPAYLQALAAQAGLSLDGYRWGLWAGGQYSSRKVLFFLFEGAQTAPRYLVKLVRDAAFNDRLENEARALQQLHTQGFGERHLLPQVAFSGCAGDLFVVGETIVEGAPFLSQTALSPTCPLAQAAVAWLTDLGAQTVSWQPAQEVAGALQRLFERFQALYRLPAAERDFLAGQIARLGETDTPFPLVFQHGDPGPWNMLVAPDGRVALLDWESAEPQGMPLWDLLYFLRSYALNVSRVAGISDRLEGVARHLLEESLLSAWIVGTVRDYCAQVRLGSQYVEPLYYACWMHRALKQATLLPPDRLKQGVYVRLLRHSIERRDAPTLRALFAAGDPSGYSFP